MFDEARAELEKRQVGELGTHDLQAEEKAELGRPECWNAQDWIPKERPDEALSSFSSCLIWSSSFTPILGAAVAVEGVMRKSYAPMTASNLARYSGCRFSLLT